MYFFITFLLQPFSLFTNPWDYFCCWLRVYHNKIRFHKRIWIHYFLWFGFTITFKISQLIDQKIDNMNKLRLNFIFLLLILEVTLFAFDIVFCLLLYNIFFNYFYLIIALFFSLAILPFMFESVLCFFLVLWKRYLKTTSLNLSKKFNLRLLFDCIFYFCFRFYSFVSLC